MAYKTNVKILMKERGINNSAMGRALGISSQAVSQWFSQDGSPPKDRIEEIAKVLRVTPDALLSNDIDRLLAAKPEKQPSTGDYDQIRRLIVRPGMGGPGFAEDDDYAESVLLPANLIKYELKGVPKDFLSMEVEGQSMEPALQSGDEILIDRRKTDPSQSGLFVLWDGDGLVAKWVEKAAGSEPAALRLMSENKRFSTYEVLVEQARIVGRIVWFARKL